MFGVKKSKYKKQKPAFRVAPPNVGMRYETNRMVVLPEGSRKEKNFYSIYGKDGKPKKSMIKRFSWKENLKKQKNYEYKHVEKIGNNKKPWIKAL